MQQHRWREAREGRKSCPRLVGERSAQVAGREACAGGSDLPVVVGVRIDQHVVEQVDAPLLTVHHAHAVEDPQGGARRRGDGRGAAAHQAARRTGPGDVRVCGAATGTGIISARRPWPCGRTRIRNDLRWRVQTGMV